MARINVCPACNAQRNRVKSRIAFKHTCGIDEPQNITIQKPKIKTNYSVAWDNYTTTNDYEKSIATMRAHGMKQPYIDNVIKVAFAAAFRASGVKIEII